MINSKFCNSCKKFLDIINFSKCSRDGFQSKCKTCKSLYQKNNRSKKLIWQTTYRNNNKESLKEKRKKYYYENKQKEIEYAKKWNFKNIDKLRAKYAKRRALKNKATPPWLTKEHFHQIQQFYTQAIILQKQTGIEFHVDHIHPLQGKNICGLHVPWNLQVIPKSENLKKGNKL